MIPLFALVSMQSEQSGGFRLWLPLFLVWLLLLPLAVLLLPVIFIICMVRQVNPLRALGLGWQVFAGLTGTHIEFEECNHSFLIRII